MNSKWGERWYWDWMNSNAKQRPPQSNGIRNRTEWKTFNFSYGSSLQALAKRLSNIKIYMPTGGGHQIFWLTKNLFRSLFCYIISSIFNFEKQKKMRKVYTSRAILKIFAPNRILECGGGGSNSSTTTTDNYITAFRYFVSLVCRMLQLFHFALYLTVDTAWQDYNQLFLFSNAAQNPRISRPKIIVINFMPNLIEKLKSTEPTERGRTVFFVCVCAQNLWAASEFRVHLYEVDFDFLGDWCDRLLHIFSFFDGNWKSISFKRNGRVRRTQKLVKMN